MSDNPFLNTDADAEPHTTVNADSSGIGSTAMPQVNLTAPSFDAAKSWETMQRVPAC